MAKKKSRLHTAVICGAVAAGVACGVVAYLKRDDLKKLVSKFKSDDFDDDDLFEDDFDDDDLFDDDDESEDAERDIVIPSVEEADDSAANIEVEIEVETEEAPAEEEK